MAQTTRLLLRAMALSIALIGSSVSAQGFTHFAHKAGDGAIVFPQTLILSKPDVQVRELTASGIQEKVPQWGEQASVGVRAALESVMAQRGDFKVSPLPTLTDKEQDELDEFLTAYWVVGQAAHFMMNYGGSAWEHRRSKFDYTLGEGLPWLREKTGADAIVVALGDDVVSSGGRVAITVLAAAAGVGLQGGRSIISFAVVDLRNGNISWLHYDQSGIRDLKNPESAKVMTQAVFKSLPAGGKVVIGK